MHIKPVQPVTLAQFSQGADHKQPAQREFRLEAAEEKAAPSAATKTDDKAPPAPPSMLQIKIQEALDAQREAALDKASG